MLPDNRVNRNECYHDPKVHAQMMKYMTNYLAYALEQASLKDLHDQEFVLGLNVEQNFDPGDLENKMFQRIRMKDRPGPDASGASPHQLGLPAMNASCKRDVWSKAHHLLEFGHVWTCLFQ